MTRNELYEAVERVKTETHEALSALWEELNHGQRVKLLKNENIVSLLGRYGVGGEEK